MVVAPTAYRYLPSPSVTSCVGIVPAVENGDPGTAVSEPSELMVSALIIPGPPTNKNRPCGSAAIAGPVIVYGLFGTGVSAPVDELIENPSNTELVAAI